MGEQRTRDQTLTSIAEIRAARTKTKKEELRRKYGAKEVENHFLKIPLDLNRSVKFRNIITFVVLVLLG